MANCWKPAYKNTADWEDKSCKGSNRWTPGRYTSSIPCIAIPCLMVPCTPRDPVDWMEYSQDGKCILGYGSAFYSSAFQFEAFS